MNKRFVFVSQKIWGILMLVVGLILVLMKAFTSILSLQGTLMVIAGIVMLIPKKGFIEFDSDRILYKASNRSNEISIPLKEIIELKSTKNKIVIHYEMNKVNILKQNYHKNSWLEIVEIFKDIKTRISKTVL